MSSQNDDAFQLTEVLYNRFAHCKMLSKRQFLFVQLGIDESSQS